MNARVAVPPDGEERPTAMTSAITVLAPYMGLKNEDTVGYLYIFKVVLSLPEMCHCLRPPVLTIPFFVDFFFTLSFGFLSKFVRKSSAYCLLQTFIAGRKRAQNVIKIQLSAASIEVNRLSIVLLISFVMCDATIE